MSSTSSSPGRIRHYGVILAALLLAVTLVRSLHIEADPPHDLSYACLADFTDEGYKTYHARNRVLFSSWLWHPADQYSYWIRHSPLSLGLHALWFQLWGGRVNLPVVRSLHLLVGLLALLIWAAAIRRELGERTALLTTLLLGFSFIGSMYGRMAFLENLLGPVHAGLVWLLCRQRLRLWHVLAAALLAAVGLLTKVTVVYFFAAAGCAVLVLTLRALLARRVADGRRRVVLLRRVALAAVGLGLLGYGLGLLLPEVVARFLPLAGRNPLAGPLDLARNLAYVQFVTKTPFLFALAMWGAGLAIARSLSARCREPWLVVVGAYWLVVGFLLLALFEGNADRSRYYLFLLPPMALLAAHRVLTAWQGSRAVDAGSSLATEEPQSRPGFAGRSLAALLAALVVVNLAVGIYHLLTDVDTRLALVDVFRGSARPGQLARALPLPVIGTAVYFALLGVGWRCWRRGLRRPVIAALLVLAMGTELWQLGRWIVHPPYAMQQAREDLQRRLPADAVLAGQWAPALALGSRLRSLHLHYSINIREGRLARLAPTHLLLLESRPEENELIDRLYPGLVRPEGLLATYRIASYVLRLYGLDWEKVSKQEGPEAGASPHEP